MSSAAEIRLSASHLVDRFQGSVQIFGEPCPCAGQFEHRVGYQLLSTRKKN